MTCETLLIDCITEELPPGQIVLLSESLKNAISAFLNDHLIEFKTIKAIGAPRHLGLIVSHCGTQQPAQKNTVKGPAMRAAKEANGQWTKAALGFAMKFGVAPEALFEVDGKLAAEQNLPAQPLETLLAKNLPDIFDKLPVAKRMRWSDHAYAFARPVHGLVIMHGKNSLNNISLYGHQASNITVGHRYHHPDPVVLTCADDFEKALCDAKVIVDFTTRRQAVEKALTEQAKSLNLQLKIDENLLNEVSNLIEWPTVLVAQFDADFLSLPKEIPITAMQLHQRYFPLFTADNALSNKFLVVSNSLSTHPDTIKNGNERVVRARLHDAAFFFSADKKVPLAARIQALDRVVFQNKLGSLGDKTRRISALAGVIAPRVGADSSLAQRAALLCKTDLLTQMVGEFPELQGFMGGQYARHDGENEPVAIAIETHYKPAFSNDTLPDSPEGIAVSLADKIDTLVGIFGIGMKPTGNKDPFALRRQMLGVLRILVEKKLDLGFSDVLNHAFSLYECPLDPAAVPGLISFAKQRFVAWFADQNIGPQIVQSVLAAGAEEPNDIGQRIEAIQAFLRLEQAPALAAANKRVSNLLDKSAQSEQETIFDPTHLIEPTEKALFDAITTLRTATQPLVENKAYTQVLTQLSALQPLVDEFFEQVMVMVDDDQLRACRLELLKSLRALFLQVADISELCI